MQSRFKFFLAVILLMAVGATVYLIRNEQKQISAVRVDSSPQIDLSFNLKWGGPKNISMLPLIAEAQGFFTNHQVQATYIDIQTGKKAMDAVRSGDIDLGILVDSNIGFAGFEQADDLRILACIMTKRDDALLVSRSAVQSPTNLVGQNIGVTLGTTTHAYLIQWLKANGLKPNSVQLQNMPPPAIQAGLLSGSLNAGALWQPFRHNVLAAKADEFLEFKDPKVYTSFVLLVSSKRFLETSRASVGIGNFLKALTDAESFAATELESAQGLIADRLGLPLEVTKKIWSEYDLKVFLSKEVLALLETEAVWIKETVPEHSNKPSPNYRSFFHAEVLRSVDAARVKDL